MSDREVLVGMPAEPLYQLHLAAKRCRAIAREHGATTPQLSRLVRATDVELCDRAIAGALTGREILAIGAIS